VAVAGGLGSPGTVRPTLEGRLAAAGGGKVWGGEVGHLLHPVVEVGLRRRWLSTVDGGVRFRVVRGAWRVLRSTNG